MAPFLFVFAMLLSQMLIVRGNVGDPFTSFLHKSQIVENSSTLLVSRTSVGESASSSPSSNSPNSHITALLPENNSSVSIERSEVAENESMLNCEYITLETERHSFLLNLKYSQILSSLNSSFYVKNGDLLTVCKDPWLEKVNRFFTVLAEVFACSIVLLVNCMMPNAFYHGRRGLIAMILILLLFTSSWFLLSDGSEEDLWGILHTVAGVANFIVMSIYAWMNIFTSSIVVNYLKSHCYIRITKYSDNQYTIHILNEKHFPSTVRFLGIFLFWLTYLMGTKLRDMSCALPRDKVLLYLMPTYFFIFFTWFFIKVTNKLFRCSRVRDFRRKVKLLQESFNALLLMSIVTYLLALYLTDFRRLGPNWLYYYVASIVAVGTLAGVYFLRKFRNSSEFDYDANTGQQQEDFIYMFRVFFDVDKKHLFGCTVFDCEKAERRYEEESGKKSYMRASFKQILHEVGV